MSSAAPQILCDFCGIDISVGNLKNSFLGPICQVKADSVLKQLKHIMVPKQFNVLLKTVVQWIDLPTTGLH